MPDSQLYAARVLGRLASIGLTTNELIDESGAISTSTVSKYRAASKGLAELKEPQNATFTRIDKVCDWVPGSARALWFEGAEPTLINTDVVVRTIRPDSVAPDAMDLHAYIQRLEERVEFLERLVGIEDAPLAAREQRSAGRMLRQQQDEDATGPQ